VLGNTQSGRPAGKCHRKQTADGGTGLRSGLAQVRVKRCGKSAPAPGVTRAARQTPPGARPRRGRTARPQTPPGRPLEPAGNRRPRGMAASGATRSTERRRLDRIRRMADSPPTSLSCLRARVRQDRSGGVYTKSPDQLVGYWCIPVLTQRSKASMFSGGQAPSQGIEPFWTRSRMSGAWALTST
jgi:hypothetical protein